jgi:hypothetical protein
MYQPRYDKSRALVVGINEYKSASPLANSCNDASAVANTLRERYGFDGKNVCLLTDEDATRNRIFEEFMAFTSETVSIDDRILFFFAGHGFTVTGARGEIGFLVPHDGNVDHLHTLIPWRELISSSELIPAKHLFFVVDACYGGLALKRYLKPGSARFARDMLLRLSRQVIAAGKANETVSDAGGPRPGHSIFTGHFLNGLDGAATPPNGILTANSLMAYAYTEVSQDYHSQQTPHYGIVDGDGDFILDQLALNEIHLDESRGEDTLVSVPLKYADQIDSDLTDSLAAQVKEYISDPKFRVRLDDLVTEETRKCTAEIADEKFSFQAHDTSLNVEEISERLKVYNSATDRLIKIVILLAKWADAEQREMLRTIFSRLPDAQTSSGGLVALLGLRWYPITRLSYAGGIAAINSKKMENLAAILLSTISYDHGKPEPVIQASVNGMHDVTRGEVFKRLPGHERHYAPMSEYFYTNVQPDIDDLLFLGKGYEKSFDEFEVLRALVVADLRAQEGVRIWGPLGRFGWKYSRDYAGGSPYADVVKDAERQQGEWPLLRAGFFGGSYQRFSTTALEFEKILEGLHWF